MVCYCKKTQWNSNGKEMELENQITCIHKTGVYTHTFYFFCRECGHTVKVDIKEEI